MRRVALGIGCAATIAGALLACGASRLPAPTLAGQPTEALLQADYPPPPGRVEFVPASPRSDAVWVDGEWTWQGQRWSWKPGRWVTPPANATFSPWTAVRDTMGTLYVAEGRWRDGKGNDLPDPPPLAVAKVRGGSVTNAEGEDVPQTPNVRVEERGEGAAKSVPRDAAAGPPETPSGATPTGTEPKSGAPRDAGLPDAPARDAGTDAMPLGESSSASSARVAAP